MGKKSHPQENYSIESAFASTPFVTPNLNRQEKLNKRRMIQLENAAALRHHGHTEYAQKLENCVIKGEPKTDLEPVYQVIPKRCETRYCSFCGERLGKKCAKTQLAKLRKYIDKGYFVTGTTLTVPNAPNLEWAHFAWIFDCFKALKESAILRGVAIGAIVKADLTYNHQSLDYHLHLHAILVHNTRLPSKQEISEQWYECTMGGMNWSEPSDVPEYPGRIIDIEPIGRKQKAISTNKTIENAVKYLCKPISIYQGNAFVKYYEATYDRPILRHYGAMHGNSIQARAILDIGGNELATLQVREAQTNRASNSMDMTRNLNDIHTHTMSAPLYNSSGQMVVEEPNQIIVDVAGKDTSATLSSAEAAGVVEGGGVAGVVGKGSGSGEMEKFKPGEEAFILAENARLKYKASEIKREKEKAARARQTMSMRGGVDCPGCSTIMPPERDLCVKCEAMEKIILENQKARKIVNSNKA